MVMAVDGLHVPAAGREPGGMIVGNREVGPAVDGDRIVVEQNDELAEAQMAGEGDRLVADPFHQAAVAGNHIGVVIDQSIPVAGVAQAFGEGQSHRHGEPLPQGTGGHLDPGRVAVFRVARGFRSELAEVPDLVDGHVLVPGQVEERIEQHRAVPRRQHEAVPVGPVRRRGIELQEPGKQHRRRVGHAHGHPRMPGIGSLNGVRREKADCIGHLEQVGRGGGWGILQGGDRLVRGHQARTPAFEAAPGITADVQELYESRSDP